MYSRTRALALSLTLILVPSVWKAKHTHSHSLKQEGQAHSLSDKASHSLIHRMEATLTFTRRQTRRVEGTCTHKHLVSLRDSHSPRGTAHAFSRSHREWKDNPLSRSHSGEKHTHFYFLTWFHSLILTQGDSARILTLSRRMEGQPTLTFPQGGKAHSLLLSHTEGKENTLLITLTRDGESTH